MPTRKGSRNSKAWRIVFSRDWVPAPPTVTMAEAHIIALTKCVAYLHQHFESFKEILDGSSESDRGYLDGVLESDIMKKFHDLIDALGGEARHVGSLANVLSDDEYRRRAWDQMSFQSFMPI